MRVYDRNNKEITVGTEIVWASKHGCRAVLKRGIVEQISMEGIKARISNFSWGRNEGVYLARLPFSLWRKPEDDIRTEAEVI